MPEDYYELLKVGRDADLKEIKSAYRRLAGLYHPDRSRDPASREKMAMINEAYSVLRDPVKRLHYDRELSRMEGRREGRRATRGYFHFSAREILDKYRDYFPAVDLRPKEVPGFDAVYEGRRLLRSYFVFFRVVERASGAETEKAFRDIKRYLMKRSFLTSETFLVLVVREDGRSIQGPFPSDEGVRVALFDYSEGRLYCGEKGRVPQKG